MSECSLLALLRHMLILLAAWPQELYVLLSMYMSGNSMTTSDVTIKHVEMSA